MVVFIKSAVNDGDPVFMFLDLVELVSQTAEVVSSSLVKCLKSSGFTEVFLQQNWISLVTDGASVMLGKRQALQLDIVRCIHLFFRGIA